MLWLYYIITKEKTRYCLTEKENWKDIGRIFKKYSNLNIKDYVYKQVLIPKTDGSMRPLGVPSKEWRLFLAGLSMILMVYLSIYQHPNQHGYLPNRGTDSAWQHMDERILGKR